MHSRIYRTWLTSGTWTKRCRRKSWETGSETCTVLNVKDPLQVLDFFSRSRPRSITSRCTSRRTLPFSLRPPLYLRLAAATSGSFGYRVWLFECEQPAVSSKLYDRALVERDPDVSTDMSWAHWFRETTSGHATIRTRTCSREISNEERAEAMPVQNADWTTGEAQRGVLRTVCSGPLCYSHPLVRPSLSLSHPRFSFPEHPNPPLHPSSFARAFSRLPRRAPPQRVRRYAIVLTEI